jgi:hypothetical protein
MVSPNPGLAIFKVNPESVLGLAARAPFPQPGVCREQVNVELLILAVIAKPGNNQAAAISAKQPSRSEEHTFQRCVTTSRLLAKCALPAHKPSGIRGPCGRHGNRIPFTNSARLPLP